MIQELEISVPQSYEDITLKEYLAVQKELKNYEGDEEAQTAVMVTYLCDIPMEHLVNMSKADFELVKQLLSGWLGNTEYDLQRFITIDGVEYGIEPNLSDMSYGAFVDITKYDTMGIDENWSKILSILYRPVTKKVRDTYEIKAYDGIIDDKLFLNTSMAFNFGVMGFFLSLHHDLMKSILNSLKGVELPHNIKSILDESGEAIQQSWNSLMKISQK